MKYLFYPLLCLFAVIAILLVTGCAVPMRENVDAEALRKAYHLDRLIVGKRIPYDEECGGDASSNRYGYRVHMKTMDGKVLTGIICRRAAQFPWQLYIDGPSLLLNE